MVSAGLQQFADFAAFFSGPASSCKFGPAATNQKVGSSSLSGRATFSFFSFSYKPPFSPGTLPQRRCHANVTLRAPRRPCRWLAPCARSPNRCLPTLAGFLPVWRELFGLGLQADSSTGERCSLRRHEPSSAGLQAKAFGHQKMAVESTLRPHNDGVAR